MSPGGGQAGRSWSPLSFRTSLRGDCASFCTLIFKWTIKTTVLSILKFSLIFYCFNNTNLTISLKGKTEKNGEAEE